MKQTFWCLYVNHLLGSVNLIWKKRKLQKQVLNIFWWIIYLIGFFLNVDENIGVQIIKIDPFWARKGLIGSWIICFTVYPITSAHLIMISPAKFQLPNPSIKAIKCIPRYWSVSRFVWKSKKLYNFYRACS